MCLYVCHKIVCVRACVRVCVCLLSLPRSIPGPSLVEGERWGERRKKKMGNRERGGWKDDGEDEQTRWEGKEVERRGVILNTSGLLSTRSHCGS